MFRYHMFWCLYVLLLFTMYNRVSRSHPIVAEFFAQLRQSQGPSTPIGASGYCWGGKHVVLLAQEDSGVEVDGHGLPLIDAGFAGHPAWLEVPGDLEKLKRPTAFALADKDTSLPLEKAAKIKAVVEELPEGARGEACIYENCGHGFCSRADFLHKESEIAQKVDEAERQCVAWFDRHFHK
jgi:dienelactone hydrolase